MSNISINLVVLRSPDLPRAVEFYSRLGLQFSQHRHGNGPEHFAAELLGGGVFELYPIAPDGPSTAGTRIGFRVPLVDAALAALSDYPGCIITPAKNSERDHVQRDLQVGEIDTRMNAKGYVFCPFCHKTF